VGAIGRDSQVFVVRELPKSNTAFPQFGSEA